MTKSRIGFWLLISLIPAGLGTFISMLVGIATSVSDPSSDSNGWAVTIILFAMYFGAALIAGILLRIWGGAETRKAYRQVRQYAELNGWQEISPNSWRTFKSSGTLLSANQAFEKKTHILTIKLEDETLIVEGFETSLLALQFGDWLWNRQAEFKTGLNIEVVKQQRTEWEQTRALAIDPRSRRI